MGLRQPNGPAIKRPFFYLKSSQKDEIKDSYQVNDDRDWALGLTQNDRPIIPLGTKQQERIALLELCLQLCFCKMIKEVTHILCMPSGPQLPSRNQYAPTDYYNIRFNSCRLQIRIALGVFFLKRA